MKRITTVGLSIAALVSNPGALSAPRSATAFAITNGSFGDACFGG